MFLPESREILGRIHVHLATWRAARLSEQLLTSIQHEFETLKDLSVAADVDDVATLSHSVASLLAQSGGVYNNVDYANGDETDDVALLNLLEETHDGLSMDLDSSEESSRTHVKFLNNMFASLLLNEGWRIENEEQHGSEVERIVDDVVPVDAHVDQVLEVEQTPQYDQQPEPIEGDADDHQLMSLINLSNEFGMSTTRTERILENTRQDVDALHAAIEQMRAAPHDPNADVAAQGIDALTDVARALSERTAQLNDVLSEGFHLGDQLHEYLLNVRMRAFSEYLPGLRRMVEKTAARNNKRVELFFNGGDVKVDRQVMNCMLAPLEHLICDAIERGIEPTGVWKETSADGCISISVTQQGTELLLEYVDDGDSLDWGELSANAVNMSMVERADEVGEAHLLQIITQPGYVADAGRGAGMALLYQTMCELGGSLALNSQVGNGVRVQFRLPQTLTFSRAVVVEAGESRFAILLHTVERLMRVREAEMVMSDYHEYIYIEGQQIPIINLADKIGETSRRSDTVQGHALTSLVLIRLVDRLIALEVDMFHGVTNITSANANSRAHTTYGVAGVAMLPDSSSVSILDSSSLIDRSKLESEALLHFPLNVTSDGEVKALQNMQSTSNDSDSVASDSMQVVALKTNVGPLLIPVSMVAEIVGTVKLRPSQHTHQWIYGDFRWRGFNVPLIDSAGVIGGELESDQSGMRAVILSPLQGSKPNDFFAFASRNEIEIIEIERGLIATPSNSRRQENQLHEVQLANQIGVIPDLKNIAHRIFHVI